MPREEEMLGFKSVSLLTVLYGVTVVVECVVCSQLMKVSVAC